MTLRQKDNGRPVRRNIDAPLVEVARSETHRIGTIQQQNPDVRPFVVRVSLVISAEIRSRNPPGSPGPLLLVEILDVFDPLGCDNDQTRPVGEPNNLAHTELELGDHCCLSARRGHNRQLSCGIFVVRLANERETVTRRRPSWGRVVQS
ncbi:hypothetical protein BMS3Bbin02_00608 [bacterium BMS3Bbin02]|nr:hypothetical protein BMS3Bbin02_00608 [bacterium BMS3Bbin02]